VVRALTDAERGSLSASAAKYVSVARAHAHAGIGTFRRDC